MNRDTLDFTVRNLVCWLFRNRTPESWIFRGAVAVLAAIWAPNLLLEFYELYADNDQSRGDSTTGFDKTRIAVSATCSILMLGAGLFSYKRYTDDRSRKKIIVIEGRGLRDEDGEPLSDALPKVNVGIRIPYLLDLRQRADGSLVDPEVLISRITAMITWLNQVKGGHDRGDLTTVYGGLTAVPLTFLTGVLVDDENKVLVMDWDRNRSQWRPLDDQDDDMRYEITGINSINGASEVVLAISSSYLVKSEDIATTFSHPVIRMTMPNLQTSHLSEKKQAALAEQFLGVIKQLDAGGVTCVHLILAAQNSVVFNLARRYDKRNLPSIVVYQFERDKIPRYPWGIDMPVAGLASATIVHVAND